MKKGWQCVFRTHDEIEAALKKSLLEGSGISVILDSSTFIYRSALPQDNQYTLYVPEVCVEQAREVLRTFDEN